MQKKEEFLYYNYCFLYFKLGEILENIDLTYLNDKQKEGVLFTEGPLLILAGAGSGKTRVLTYRTAHLIKDLGVRPYNIMAITFTNKASKEMKDRIQKMVGDIQGEVWISTFHSACVRILRSFSDRISYGNNFTIYDTDDTKRLMKNILKDMQIDTKDIKVKTILNKISSLKNELINAEDYANLYHKNQREELISQVYLEYQSRLLHNNCMDFDDLIMNVVFLFKRFPDVLSFYEDRLHYIMVDEYQDTNKAQFEFIKLISKKRRNLCVVGDDDQSIYKFRGANIYNILNFEQYFPDAKIIKLEQNYRSTENILNAANAVIKNNKGRKNKKLWTKSINGDKITFRQFDSAYEEADYIANDIKLKGDYTDTAILYRTNSQSRLLEEKLIKRNIPYRIIGGINFYARMEIKDILSYLHVISNEKDDLSIKRIINVPSRGIGNVTINKIDSYAKEYNISFFEALKDIDKITAISRGKDKIKKFVLLLDELFLLRKQEKIAPIIKGVIDKSGYRDELLLENTEESKARLLNIEEFISKGVSFDESLKEDRDDNLNKEVSDSKNNNILSLFLEEVSLIADIDNLNENLSYISLMTLHSAKGLEFSNLYISGLEDGLFPSFMSIETGDDSDIEEERRLFYVGITRAKKNLTITCAKSRMINGETLYSPISRFIKEIPKDVMNVENKSNYDNIYIKKTKVNNYSTHNKSFKLKENKTQYGIHIEKQMPPYKEGDIVVHRKFGEGKVLSIEDNEKDFLVSVDFYNYGKKKMFASFAKLIRK